MEAQQEGYATLGGFIGPPEKRAEFVKKEISKLKDKMQAIEPLRKQTQDNEILVVRDEDEHDDGPQQEGEIHVKSKIQWRIVCFIASCVESSWTSTKCIRHMRTDGTLP